jgi:hypothetical protein
VAGSFLIGAGGSLKSRESDVEDEEKRRLKSVVASVSVENELLREKIAKMEDGRPFGVVEVETMSRTVSPSIHPPYGVARVTGLEPGAFQFLCRSSSPAASARAAKARPQDIVPREARHDFQLDLEAAA